MLCDNALLIAIVLQFLWEEFVLHTRRSAAAFVSWSRHCTMQKEGLSQTSA